MSELQLLQKRALIDAQKLFRDAGVPFEVLLADHHDVGADNRNLQSLTFNLSLTPNSDSLKSSLLNSLEHPTKPLEQSLIAQFNTHTSHMLQPFLIILSTL